MDMLMLILVLGEWGLNYISSLLQSIPINPTLPPWVVFKQREASLYLKFSFSLISCLTKAEKTSLPYYLPITRRTRVGFILFPRLLAWTDMRSASSKIWTRVISSFSYDCNHYSKCVSFLATYDFMLFYLSRTYFSFFHGFLKSS